MGLSWGLQEFTAWAALVSSIGVLCTLDDHTVYGRLCSFGPAIIGCCVRRLFRFASHSTSRSKLRHLCCEFVMWVKQVIREIHHSAGDHCTWRDADAIGAHLVDSIAIAVQRCTGMALQASLARESRVAMGTAAA